MYKVQEEKGRENLYYIVSALLSINNINFENRARVREIISKNELKYWLNKIYIWDEVVLLSIDNNSYELHVNEKLYIINAANKEPNDFIYITETEKQPEESFDDMVQWIIEQKNSPEYINEAKVFQEKEMNRLIAQANEDLIGDNKLSLRKKTEEDTEEDTFYIVYWNKELIVPNLYNTWYTVDASKILDAIVDTANSQEDIKFYMRSRYRSIKIGKQEINTQDFIKKVPFSDGNDPVLQNDKYEVALIDTWAHKYNEEVFQFIANIKNISYKDHVHVDLWKSTDLLSAAIINTTKSEEEQIKVLHQIEDWYSKGASKHIHSIEMAQYKNG